VNWRKRRKEKPLSRDAECADATNVRGEKMGRNRSADNSL
jgi:hypothetical protein